MCSPGLSYTKAKETKVEVTPDFVRKIVAETDFHKIYRGWKKNQRLEYAKESPKRLPRGVHPAGKFRRPKV